MQKMALFKQSDPEVILQKAIDAEHAVRDQLEARLVAAKRTAEESQHAARKAEHKEDDRTITALVDKQTAAERRVKNLESEIAEITMRLTDPKEGLEAKLEIAKDQRIRKGTAREVELIAEGFAAAADNTVKALAALVLQTEKMILFLPDAQGLHQFASRVQGELPDNIRMLTGLLRSYCDGVLAGGYGATLPAPAPKPIPLPPRAPVVAVTALKAVAFIDTAGMVQTAARGTDIELPPKTAQRAIEIGACCAMDDPRRRTVKDNPGRLGKPLFRNCVQLSDGMVDTDREPFAPEPVMRSAPPGTPDPRFQIVPPSQLPPPRQIQVEGARSLDNVARNNKDKT